MFLYVAGIASDVSIAKLDDSDITKVTSYYCLFPMLCSGMSV